MPILVRIDAVLTSFHYHIFLSDCSMFFMRKKTYCIDFIFNNKCRPYKCFCELFLGFSMLGNSSVIWPIAADKAKRDASFRASVLYLNDDGDCMHAVN